LRMWDTQTRRMDKGILINQLRTVQTSSAKKESLFMKEYFISKANCKLRYHDFPGKGVPILFIHGLGCAGSFDYPQVAAQKALQGRHCVLIDLLGAGFSDKPEDFGYTVNEHAEYLAEFVVAMGFESFVLYGHSLGGAVALSLADKCRERVLKIVLSEANLDKSGEGSTSKYIADFEMHEFVNNGFFRLLQESKANGNEMWAASLSVWSPKAAYLISKSAANGEKPSWRDILYSLECPRTFIFGENSLPDPDVKVLAEHGVNVEIVKQAGHSMAWENPQGLAEVIENSI